MGAPSHQNALDLHLHRPLAHRPHLDPARQDVTVVGPHLVAVWTMVRLVSTNAAVRSVIAVGLQLAVVWTMVRLVSARAVATPWPTAQKCRCNRIGMQNITFDSNQLIIDQWFQQMYFQSFFDQEDQRA